MARTETHSLLRALPSVEHLVQNVPERYASHIDRTFVTACAREAVQEIREAILAGKCAGTSQIPEKVQQAFRRKLDRLLNRSLRPVINCTGIVLHTGLGRAVLSEAAVSHVQSILSGYCNLELDLDSGRRGDRTTHVEALLCTLTGAEAACVVNNNAAAVLIALNTLAEGREVLISRGELIEIGGSFRIPEVMAKSGAIMVEVGTTNKTHFHDFAGAITPQTAGILHVHPSNYRIQGFTKRVPLSELVELARQRGLFVLHDLGGGILTDLRQFGLPYEPVVQESVQAGADLITFSGDKVLGGPQSGIIVGKQAHVQRIKKNPLMRAVRCDKLTYALLESTLRLFLHPGTLQQTHQVLRMLSEPADAVRSRAERIAAAFQDLPGAWNMEVVETHAQAGSGTLPLEKIPSFALRITSDRQDVHELAYRMRLENPAVVGYTQRNALYLDMRTVLPDQVEMLIDVLKRHWQAG